MATVAQDVDQIADPVHPNHQKENRKFEPLAAGARVYLVDKLTRKKTNYWQVYDGYRPDGLIGWIPQLSGGDLNLEPYQPDCPTDFPLTAEALSELNTVAGSLLTCFGNTELTLAGTVTCNRPEVDSTFAGASFLDTHRSCFLGNAEDPRIDLFGNEIFELLEAPPVDEISGRYLVRGHFDDPDAQACFSVPFGTSIGPEPGHPSDPGAVMACRNLFVVSTVISQT